MGRHAGMQTTGAQQRVLREQAAHAQAAITSNKPAYLADDLLAACDVLLCTPQLVLGPHLLTAARHSTVGGNNTCQQLQATRTGHPAA